MRIIPKHQGGHSIQKPQFYGEYARKLNPFEMNGLSPEQFAVLMEQLKSKKPKKSPYRVTKDTKNGVTRTTEEGGYPDSNSYADDSFWEQFMNQTGDSVASALYPRGLGNGTKIEGDSSIYRILGDRYYGRK